MMDHQELAGFTLFEGMTEDELKHSATAFEPIRRMAGERVTKEDDFGYSFFLILKGRVSVETHGDNVAELEAGDCFGEVALVTGEKRNATVRALETVELAKTMAWEFSDLLGTNPLLAERIKAIADTRRPSE